MRVVSWVNRVPERGIEYSFADVKRGQYIAFLRGTIVDVCAAIPEGARDMRIVIDLVADVSR